MVAAHPEERMGVLLVELYNIFNEENQTVILWEVWLEWPSGAYFTFNCYLHMDTLLIQHTGG